jgi:mono/diheme cytochrome c family protein
MKHLALAIGVALVLPMGARNAAAQAQAPDGQALYRENCRSCHGPTGVPTPRMAALYKNLLALDSAYLAGRSEDSIVAVLQHGIGRDMKSFKEKLTPDQMRAVTAYIRVLEGAVAKPAAP